LNDGALNDDLKDGERKNSLAGKADFHAPVFWENDVPPDAEALHRPVS
jgi:hypothetical protein